MKITTISETFGYTIDTYHVFEPWSFVENDEEITEDHDLDHDGYRHDLAEHQEDVLNEYTDGVVKSFSHVGDTSPREYNFATDNSDLVIELDYRKLTNYVHKNRVEFEQFLKDNFTSYDGFWSYVANTSQEFYQQMTESEVDHDRNIAIMAGWYFKRECLDDDTYFDDMYEGIHELVYHNIIEPKEAKS